MLRHLWRAAYRSNVRSVISKISDINDEEESFCSNPSSSSFTSTILSSICTRRTAATAAAAAYTNKLVPMSRAWVSGRERLNANKSSKPTSSLDNSNLYDEIQGLDYEIEIVDNDNDNNYEESSYDTSLNISKKNLFDVTNVASCQKKFIGWLGGC